MKRFLLYSELKPEKVEEYSKIKLMCENEFKDNREGYAKIKDPFIEETIKMVLELNITNLITCDMSPIIPDRLIGCGEFLKNTNNSIDLSCEKFAVPK